VDFYLEGGGLVQYYTVQSGKNLRTIGFNLLRLSSAFSDLGIKVKVKVKVKFTHRTGHEGPEGE
jgi:hypothetical protein